MDLHVARQWAEPTFQREREGRGPAGEDVLSQRRPTRWATATQTARIRQPVGETNNIPYAFASLAA